MSLLTLSLYALTDAMAHPAPTPAAPPAASTATPPTLPVCSVLAPSMTVNGKPVVAGTMFATKVGERQVLVTAHSLFGPSSGLATQLAPDAIGKQVTTIVVRDAQNSRTECARSSKYLAVADAAAWGNGVDGAKDVAVFEVSTASGLDRLQAVAPTPLALLTFAAKAPKVNDVVWLAARVNSREGLLFQAKAVEVTPGSLYFEYVDKELDLAGTIGAPILDAAGGVVGINLGGGKLEDGALIGSATALAPIKQRVDAAGAK